MKKDKCEECNGLQYINNLCYEHNQKRKQKERFRDVWDIQRATVYPMVNRNARGINWDLFSYNRYAMNITFTQILWLNSRGGRGLDDIVVNNGELFTTMTSMHGGKYTLIPSDEGILIDYNVKKTKNGNYVLRLKK